MSDTGFGDAEPEDSWDPDDPIPVCIDNLYRRVALLGITRTDDHDTDSDDEALDDLAELIEAARELPDLTARDRIRIRHLDDDVARLRNRVN